MAGKGKIATALEALSRKWPNLGEFTETEDGRIAAKFKGAAGTEDGFLRVCQTVVNQTLHRGETLEVVLSQ